MYIERYTISCTMVTTVVHFGFNGYGSKTALLFQEGDNRRPIKFHQLPTDPEIGFPEPWAVGKSVWTTIVRGRVWTWKIHLLPVHSPTHIPTPHTRAGKVFIVSLLTYTEKWARRMKRGRERVSEWAKGWPTAGDDDGGGRGK